MNASSVGTWTGLIMLLIYIGIPIFLHRTTKKQIALGEDISNNKSPKKYIIWSVINCLFFLITGVIALVYSIKYKKATSPENMFFYGSMAKKCNIYATIVSVLTFISFIYMHS